MNTGWQTKPLSELLQKTETVDPLQSPEKEFDYVDVSSVSNKTFEIEATQRLKGKDAPSRARRLIAKDDVIFATIRPTLRRIARVPEKLSGQVCSTGYIVLRPKSILDSRYLFYFLLTDKFLGEMEKCQKGAAYPAVTDGEVRTQLLRFPSLTEQQYIVSILDEAFDFIATARANVEKNLQNARALFESHLQSVFALRGDGWIDRTLDQVCIVERGSSPRPIKEFFTTASDGVNWIKIGDTKEGEKYIYTTNQKITPEGAKSSRFVKEGDFILTNSMSYGRPYIMKTCGYIHDGWFVLRLNASINSDYFYYLISSSFVQEQFAQLASGSVVKNISGDLVKKAVLPIPPLIHQQEIVKKLLTISAETQRLESICQQKLVALDELKKSLLHQAFSGELSKNLKTAVIIPFPSVINGIEKIELQAGVLAMTYTLHEKHKREKYVGHVKAEKTAHLVESLVGIDLGRDAYKDAAGPNDAARLKDVEEQAKKAGYFIFKKIDGGRYEFNKLPQFESLIARTRQALGERCADVDHLLELMLPMNKRKAELFATVYAAWNNLLLLKKPAGDEEIVREAREEWHPDKMNIPREEFFATLAWIRQNDVIPQGKGRLVGPKKDPGELLSGLDA